MLVRLRVNEALNSHDADDDADKSHASYVRLTRFHLTHAFPPAKILSRAFLPRDAMHKRGLCCHAVSVRPSVRLSVRHVRGSRQNE